MRSRGTTAEGTESTAVASSAAQSVPMSRVASIGSFRVPLGWKIGDRDHCESYVLGYFDGRCNVIVGEFVGIRQNLQRTERSTLGSVNDGGAFMVPTASIETRAQAIVRTIAPTGEPEDQHLPNAVFDAAECVFHARGAVCRVEKRHGRYVT